jgi:hypothetical protein
VKVVLTVRRLRPRAYERFRRSWDPDGWPDGMIKAYLLRDPADAEVIVALGLFDLSDERARQLRDQLAPAEQERHARMAPYVEQTLLSGLYDVAMTDTGSATGDHTVVPLTERRLHPGSFERYLAATQAVLEAMGSDPLPGLARMMVLRDTADPDHLVQLGIVRTGDLEATMAAAAARRPAMLEAIEPFVAELGLDTTYQLVEELSPAHA